MARNPHPHALLAASPVGVMALIVAIIALGGCGGVYESVAPEQKAVVSMLMTPDFVRRGAPPQKLDVFIDVDGGAAPLLLEVDLGKDIELLASELSECGQGALLPQSLDGRVVLRLCLTVRPLEDAEISEREATLEIDTGSESVLARGALFVLRALP